MDQSMNFRQFLPSSQNTHHKGGLGLFVYPNIVLAIALCSLAGCASNTRTAQNPQFEDYAEQSGAVLADNQGTNSSPTQIARGEWTIVLTSIASGRMEHAELLLDAIQNKGGLPQAYITQRADGLAIAYGHYSGSDDSRARADLLRIRDITLEGGTPYTGSFIAPPSGASLMGSNPNHDLRTVKQRMGERAVYTLQVGVYGPDDYSDPKPSELAEYRQTAERAVVELRGEGEQAFYYHAATRSMVTVGVFSRDDHDASMTPPLESAALRGLRERYPNNTLNGLGIRETVRTEQGKMKRIQKSQLVEIPKR
jgi:hypothetical protein